MNKNDVLEAVKSVYGDTRNTVIRTFDDKNKYKNKYISATKLGTIVEMFVSYMMNYFDCIDGECDYSTHHTKYDITFDYFKDWLNNPNCEILLEALNK